MATITIEAILQVEDFYRGDRSEAFELARDSAHLAKRDALIEVRETLEFKRRPSRITVESSFFVEFDSGNLSHAGAHYHVVVSGLKDDEVAKLVAAEIGWITEGAA